MITDVDLDNINIEIEPSDLDTIGEFTIKDYPDTLPPSKQIFLTLFPEKISHESAQTYNVKVKLSDDVSTQIVEDYFQLMIFYVYLSGKIVLDWPRQIFISIDGLADELGVIEDHNSAIDDEIN